MTKTNNLYRRPDEPGGIYYIDYWRDGKRRRKSLETTVLKEAKLRRDAILAGEVDVKWGSRGKDVEPAVFWERYKAWAEIHRSKRSLERWGQFWNAFLDFAKPDKLGQVTHADVENFKAHCVTVLKWEPKTINSAVEAMRALYNHAEKMHLYGRENPFRKASRLPVPHKPPRFLSKAELDTLLDKAQSRSRDLYLFTALAAYAGLRHKEASNATWSWVDFERGCITVPSSDGKGFNTKNRRFRVVPLHSRLRAILETFRESEGYIVHPDIPAEEEKRIRYDARNGFATIATEAGVSWCTPHTLRHTFASHLVMNGVSLYKVQQWLGHQSPVVTQVYAHLAPADNDIDRF